MVEYLVPGTYMEEIPPEKPVEGVSTSVTGFLGVTERGPINEGVKVTSFIEFKKKFGGFLNDSYLAYAVDGYFRNGGQIAVISRVVHYDTDTPTSKKATKEVKATIDLAETIIGMLDAKDHGTFGNEISVEFKTGEKLGTTDFIVFYKDAEVERFEGLTSDVIDDVVNAQSEYVTYTSLKDDGFTFPVEKQKLAGGLDGTANIDSQDYLKSLTNFDKSNVNIIVAPGVTDKVALKGLNDYVTLRQDSTVITCNSLGQKIEQLVEMRKEFDSDRIQMYHSWLRVLDPIGVGKNPTKLVPNVGHVAGVYARIDNTRGVYKTPAGVEAKLIGIVGLEYDVTDDEQKLLNPVGINAIRTFDGDGTVIWGGRNLSLNYKNHYITTRRTADFVGQSLKNSTRWAVFENNDEDLWGKVSAVGNSTLASLWQAGGLKGKSESEAFFFKCDATTTTPKEVDEGKLFAIVGIATQKPAEFIVFKLALL